MYPPQAQAARTNLPSIGSDLDAARRAFQRGAYRESLAHVLDARDALVSADVLDEDLTTFQLFASVDRAIGTARQAVRDGTEERRYLGSAVEQLSFTAATLGLQA